MFSFDCISPILNGFFIFYLCRNLRFFHPSRWPPRSSYSLGCPLRQMRPSHIVTRWKHQVGFVLRQKLLLWVTSDFSFSNLVKNIFYSLQAEVDIICGSRPHPRLGWLTLTALWRRARPAWRRSAPSTCVTRTTLPSPRSMSCRLTTSNSCHPLSKCKSGENSPFLFSWLSNYQSRTRWVEGRGFNV